MDFKPSFRHGGDVRQHVLEAAPPPPRTVVGVIRAGVALPVGAVGGHELDAGVEADERHILDRFLQEDHGQLVAALVVRRQGGHLLDRVGGNLVVPAGALAGATLAQRDDQVGIPTVDLRVDVLGDAARRPVAGDVVVTGFTVGAPSGGALAGQRAVQAEGDQLVVGGLGAAAGLPRSRRCRTSR